MNREKDVEGGGQKASQNHLPVGERNIKLRENNKVSLFKKIKPAQYLVLNISKREFLWYILKLKCTSISIS